METTSRTVSLWGIECGGAWYRDPGDISLRWDYYKFDWNNSVWVRCRYVDYINNQGNTWRLWTDRDWGSSSPCGFSNYRIRAHSWLRHNYSWHGGDLYSPSHWIDS